MACVTFLTLQTLDSKVDQVCIMFPTGDKKSQEEGSTLIFEVMQ